MEHIQSETEIEKVMKATGMDAFQAMRHIEQRRALQQRMAEQARFRCTYSGLAELYESEQQGTK